MCQTKIPLEELMFYTVEERLSSIFPLLRETWIRCIFRFVEVFFD
jgi:hypothetical protein